MKYFVCLFILISSSAYADGIYKWVDGDGNTHYGDVPPPSVHTEELRVDVAPSDPGRALPRLETSDPGSSAPSPSSPGSPDGAEPSPEMTDEQAAAICKQGHHGIKVLNNSKRRSRVRKPDGGYRRMTTEERKIYRKQSEQDIKEYCK